MYIFFILDIVIVIVDLMHRVRILNEYLRS